MNRKYCLFSLVLAVILLLSGCRSTPTTQTPAASDTPSPTPTPVESVETVESPEVSEEPSFVADPNASVALVTGPLKYDFDGQLWAGVQAFCDKNGKDCWSYSGFSVFSNDSAAPLNALKAPVEDGRKVIVASSSWYLDSVQALAGQYPDTAFFVIDPYSDWTSTGSLSGNVTAAIYDQVQIGYLAGCAAVSEGYTKLGYLGFADTAYGYGFVQGANDAAGTAGVTVDILYCYADPSSTQDADRAMADLWYRSGIQLIFTSCTVDGAVIAAAEENERKVITISGDLSELSAAVLATVGPDAGQTVSRLLTAYYNNRFPGGETLTLGCGEQAVSLDISRMAKFGQYDYEHVYGKLAAGTVVPLGPADAESPEQLPCPNVKVNLIEGGQA